MNIICKEKDFYDYVGYQQNSEDITFDRRKMFCFHKGTDWADEYSVGHFVSSILSHFNYCVLGLWIGNNLHIFSLKEISDRYKEVNRFMELSENFKYEVKLLASRRCYEIKHKYPIEFCYIEVPTQYGRHFNFFSKIDNEDYAQKFFTKEFPTYNTANLIFKYFENKGPIADGFIPILKNSFVPKFLNPKEVYHDIESWLLSQYNDVTQESKGITDIDKAINHGFDKRTSFRSVK